jgi:hypothetical protein
VTLRVSCCAGPLGTALDMDHRGDDSWDTGRSIGVRAARTTGSATCSEGKTRRRRRIRLPSNAFVDLTTSRPLQAEGFPPPVSSSRSRPRHTSDRVLHKSFVCRTYVWVVARIPGCLTVNTDRHLPSLAAASQGDDTLDACDTACIQVRAVPNWGRRSAAADFGLLSRSAVVHHHHGKVRIRPRRSAADFLLASRWIVVRAGDLLVVPSHMECPTVVCRSGQQTRST